MAANKVPGVRAALCAEVTTVIGARRWNDANVLAFGLDGMTRQRLAPMLEAFLATPVDPQERPLISRLEGTD
jgi:ribose 5-phosphate isomerase B